MKQQMMKPPMAHPTIRLWPPLIYNAARPAWRIWRDRLMTICLWLLLLGLLVQQSIILSHHLNEFIFPSDPDARIVWEFRLLPFLVVALILVLRLLVWGVISKRHFNRVTREAPPPPLPPLIEARQHGVTPADLDAWRARKVATVATDEAGICHLLP